MDAIELLDLQHRDVEQLFQRFGGLDGQRKRALFQELADALAIHATIEENHFYPALKARSTEDKLRESLEEHLAIKRVLADLLKLAIDDEQFEAKMEVLREEVRHHVEEERARVFPAARRLLDAEVREAIGQLMTATMVELEGKAPRLDVLGQTVAAAPLGEPSQITSPLRRGLLGRAAAPLFQLARYTRAIVGGVADGLRAQRRRRPA